jgi:hypothetical protein
MLQKAVSNTSSSGSTILGLKRKFSFSYFRENFAKIYFRFSGKKLTKSYENNENFRENEMYEKTEAANGKYCEIC